DMPGITRDRLYADAAWDDARFTLVDTGGFLSSDEDVFAPDIREQLHIVIQSADVLVLVMDGREGLSPYDRELARILRKSAKPVFCVVNKVEHEEQLHGLYDFYSAGIEMYYPVSAEHNIGLDDFMEDLVRSLPDERKEEDEESDTIRLAVVGRPNVGKSSLVNRLFGEKRVIVNEQAGTTRDAVELELDHREKKFVLMDTAGIRKKGRVTDKVEKFSIIKSLQSMKDCDVVLLLIDSVQGVTEQDITIAGHAEEHGCGVLFVFNKWDLVEERSRKRKQLMDELKYKARFLSYAPVLTVSALTGRGAHKILDMVEKIHEQYIHRLGTGFLNRIMEDSVLRVEPPLHKGKSLKFYYTTQVSTGPPVFVSFVNYPEAVHFSYKRYLVNQIRELTGLDYTPMRLYFRERTGKMDFSSKPSGTQKKPDKSRNRKAQKRYKERKEQSRKKRQRDMG
ncbi:MAG: ribosome biogenesis GTPase Der, partial [Desulfobacteraceae bacterium]